MQTTIQVKLTPNELMAFADYNDTIVEVGSTICKAFGEVPELPTITHMDKIRIALGGKKEFQVSTPEVKIYAIVDRHGAEFNLHIEADERQTTLIIGTYGELVEIYGKAIAKSIKTFNKANEKAKDPINRLQYLFSR